VSDGDTIEDGAGTDLPDLEESGGRVRTPAPRTALATVWVVAAVAGFAYDYLVLGGEEALLLDWELAIHEWLFVLTLGLSVTHVAIPLARRPALTGRYWRRLRANPVGLASFCYLAAFFLVGMVGPVVVGVPTTATFNPTYQPPIGMGVDARFVGTCVGPVADGACTGSLAHPLGTDGNGRDMVVVVVNGMRLAVEVAFISAGILVPVATLVGTVAAEFGGRVDEFLMRVVDLQGIVPAFFVYIVLQYVFAPRLTLLLVVFGVLSWGSIARIVRSEALQRREQAYVRAVESAGGGRLWIVRRHIIPNVTNTVVPAVTLQIPTLILIEAALSFLALGDPTVNSFGWAISAGMTDTEFPRFWWIGTAPTVVLIVSVIALNLFGDALGDVLDPRRER